ncbi:MAG: hypothetical protein ACRDSZ_15300 [Pseudonocardiaceae bacterium]
MTKLRVGPTSPTTQFTVPPTAGDSSHTLLPWLREMRDEHPVWRRRGLRGTWSPATSPTGAGSRSSMTRDPTTKWYDRLVA